MPPPASEPGARPSLLRNNASDAPAHDTLRMLASLEAPHKAGSKAAGKRRGTQRSSRRTRSPGTPSAAPAWVIGGLMLTMVALAMAYLAVPRADAPSLSPPSLSPPPPAIGLQAHAASPPATAASATTAATIETLPARAKDNSAQGRDEHLATTSTAEAQATESPFNALSAESPAHGKAAAVPAAVNTTPPPVIARVSPTQAQAQAQAQAQPQALLKASAASMTVATPTTTKPPEPPTETPPAVRLSPAQQRQAARAGDSALLAALVQHVAAHSRQEVKGAMPPLRLKGSKAPMTTIAQIVDHCRSLQGEEAKVCKVRICENYWGKDDACSTRPDFHRFEATAH